MQNKSVKNRDIGVKEFFSTIFNYKYSIVAITLFSFLLTLGYLYFKTSIYSSNATIEFIKLDKQKSFGKDMLGKAFNSLGADLDTEIDVLKSRYMVGKVLDRVQLDKRYYYEHNYKTVELYKNLPFVVSMDYLDSNIKKMMFVILPIDDKNFILQVGKDSNSTLEKIKKKILPTSSKKEYKYRQKHTFGEKISTSWFTLKIDLIHKLKREKYIFIFYNSKQLIVKKLKKNLKIAQTNKESSILRISYEDNIALRAKEIVDSLSKAYIEEQLSRNRDESENSLKFIDNQLTVISKNLKKSENQLANYKKRNTIVNISASAEATLQKLTEYESEISKVDLELNVLFNLTQSVEGSEDVSGISMSVLQYPSPILSFMLKSLQEKQVEIKSLSIEFTDKHPQVVKLREQINILKKNIKKSILNTIKNLESKKRSLNRIVKKYQKSLSSLPQKEMELVNFKRGFLINEKVYSFLLQKRTETAIVKASTISNAKILDTAILLDKPIKPKRKLILIIGLILGVIIGVSLSFLREFLNNKIKNYEDLEELTDMPIYGSLPLLKSKKPNIAYIEALRVIRTNLEIIEVEGAKIIAITSSVPAEGKTTIVANVGKIIAHSSKKVVVIDLDMRKPRLDKQLGIKKIKGMSEYLRGKANIEEIIVHSKKNSLDAITAGSIPPNASELLMNPRLDKLLEILSQKYDYILLDTPPIGLVADAMLLLIKANISLIVIKSNYTLKEFVTNIDNIVKTNSIKSAGIILNAINIDKRGSKGIGKDFGNYGYGKGFGLSNYSYGYNNEDKL